MMTGKLEPQVEAIIRFAAVRRWHIVQTTRTQTLAEHACSVAMLAAHIARRSCLDPAPYLYWGLYHDSAEAFLGDTPTPAKTEHHSQAEHDIMESLGIHAPNRLVRYVVKLCDLADGIRFIRIHGVDRIGKWAEEALTDRFHLLFKGMDAHPQLSSDVLERILWEFMYETGS